MQTTTMAAPTAVPTRTKMLAAPTRTTMPAAALAAEKWQGQ